MDGLCDRLSSNLRKLFDGTLQIGDKCTRELCSFHWLSALMYSRDRRVELLLELYRNIHISSFVY